MKNGPKNSSSLSRCSFDFNEWMRTNDNNVDGGNVLIGCGMVNIGSCVVCNMITAFKDTHSQNRSLYDPTNLYKAMQERNKNLLNGKQQDAMEFWIQIMEAIENEKNSVMYNKLFSHEVFTIVKCEFCHKSSATKRIYIGHVIEILGQLTIQQAVDTYFAGDILETYECEACKIINKDMAKKSYAFKSIPNILCLVLGRFENKEKKICNSITLNEQLKLSNYIVSSERAHITYKLVSVVNHVGANLSNGHYTTTVCSSHHSLYEFDDGHVNKPDAISGSNAYILIYELSRELSPKIPLSFFRAIGMNDDNCDEMSNRQMKSKMEVEVEMDSATVSTNESRFNNGAPSEILRQNESISNEHGYSFDDHGIQNQEVMDEFDYLDDSNIQCSDNIALSGRRIVDVRFFVKQMEDLNQHSFSCDFSRMEFKKETKRGLRSIFTFECTNCGECHNIQSCYKQEDSMNVNKAAVLGVTSIGSGYYHIEELCSHLDIPCMSSSTFDKENKKLQADWGNLAKQKAEEALQEEIKLALARGDVDCCGNALITVVCDGSWGKRSYGKGFSSLSVCAAIIGVHTKKVLYYDVKNKYCDICTKSYAKFCPPNDHPCNINYYGPSSGMETKIIVEGFQFCETKGARFHKIISDGDSSAFKEIREKCIYQNPELVVEKLECNNHLFKNFHNKFIALCNDTDFDKTDRKLISPHIGDEISKGVRLAAQHWRESNVDMVKKLENLERDCLNAPYHYFGIHDNCDRYFCKKTTTAENIRTIDLLKSSGIFHEILNYCNIYFASNVRSLIEDVTNNAAEELNNVIAKYLGGKRINYSLAGSYAGRVSAAIVQYNSKGHAGSEFHKFSNIRANNTCLRMENSRIRHYAKNEAMRQIKPRKKATVDKKVTGYKEGEKEDMSGSALETAKNIQLAKFELDQTNREMILRDTVGQKYNNNWLLYRKKLINCSYFGRIVNARGPTSYPNILKELLYSPKENTNTAEVLHQRLYEGEALKMFSFMKKDYELEQTGIFIDKELSFLGASPLRLYGPDSIVYVQCPKKGFGKTVDVAINKKLLPFTHSNGDLNIKEKSAWYVEVQGQLHITGRRFAYIVVWLGTEFFTKKVEVDHSFWNDKMKKKLEYFFYECMLKELANPRRARKMDLRKYDKSTKTFI